MGRLGYDARVMAVDDGVDAVWRPTGKPYMTRRMELWVEVTATQFDELMADPSTWEKVNKMERSDDGGGVRYWVQPR